MKAYMYMYIQRKDVLLPSCLLCGPILKQLSQHAFIMTNDEDRSPVLLRQEEDTITCLISGDRSEFTLVSSPRFKDKFPADLRKLDVEQVDLTQYPGLADVEYHKANLTTGDCVYIPAKWYYQVNSFSRTTEVEVTWRRQQKSTLMTEKSCKSTISGPPTLDKFHFNNLSRHENHMEHRILHNFIGFLRHDVRLTLKEFIEKMKKDKMLKNMTEWNDEYEDIANEVFDVLNLNTDEVFSLADIDALTPLSLEQMTGLLEDRMADFEEIMQDQNVASSAKSIGGKLFDQGALAKQEALLKKMIREATSKIQEFKKTAQAIEKSIHQSEEEIRQKEKEAYAAEHKDRSTNKSNKFGEKATKPDHKKKDHEVAYQTMDDSIKEAIEDEEEIIAEPDTIEPTTKAAETPAESGSLNQNQSSMISEQKNVKKKDIHSGSDRNVKDEL
ncbi:uncharacterized protein LOC106151217 isoform X2 [Lingula anatina]|uniref:Uncharacterized protein LOC106151217 isoform X2 n=1 Tax=Lingula anatina TaxID=7574 RepID=A0A1S3H1B1_LINAN|nr:uncharacterized protein LOC106151217 isoform X2 [Lingula anatina]|eukprot:XP_013379798.1 uncharacterized protein LOC106151217 isoform X2 [Lingula anatina]